MVVVVGSHVLQAEFEKDRLVWTPGTPAQPSPILDSLWGLENGTTTPSPSSPALLPCGLQHIPAHRKLPGM